MVMFFFALMEISYEQWRSLGFLTRVLSNHSGRPDKNYEL
jgi:hypothetical protein